MLDQVNPPSLSCCSLLVSVAVVRCSLGTEGVIWLTLLCRCWSGREAGRSSVKQGSWTNDAPWLAFCFHSASFLLQPKTTNPGMALLPSCTPSLSLPHLWRPEKAATDKPGRIFSRNSISWLFNLILQNSEEQMLVTLTTRSVAFGYSIRANKLTSQVCYHFCCEIIFKLSVLKTVNTIIYNRSLKEVVKEI